MVEVIAELDDVTKVYPVRTRRTRGRAHLRAVDGVSVSVRAGRSIGLVGESGCGKSTTARLLLLLERPTSGRVLFGGDDLARAGADQLRRFRTAVQPVFQDPYSSLSPRSRVGSIVGAPVHALARLRGSELERRVEEALVQVGLDRDAPRRYPHQFSGGQRQRVALARALALRPRLVVLDEPVSALDVSIRAQILNLLKDLEEDLGLTYVLISHDLPTLRFLVAEVAVMYLGRIVEQGPTEDLFADPRHPYTKALLAAVPDVRTESADWGVLEGDPPNAIDLPSGCRFRTRCREAMDVCAEIEPVLVGTGRRAVACHLDPVSVTVRGGS